MDKRRLVRNLTFRNTFYEKCRMAWMRRWNRLKLWAYGVTYGNGLDIVDYFYLNKAENASLEIGENFCLRSGGGLNIIGRNLMSGIKLNNGAKIVIGDNVGISNAVLNSYKEIIIGNNVKIGSDTIILDSNSHSLNFAKRRISKDDRADVISKKIVIEDDVLIGTRCIVMKGVTIGARSVIAAGSVVIKSIPPDCIAGGNPCKVIKRINEA